MPKKILVDEWLSELNELQRSGGAEGFSRRDVERVLGLAEHAAGVKLRQWAYGGLIEFAGHTKGLTIDGRPCRYPVYRMAKAAKPKAKKNGGK